MLWNALNHSEPAALSPYQFVMSQHFSKPHICLGLRAATRFHSAHRPNWWFNADANISHAFGIFMAYVGALQPSASGAG